MPDDKGIKGCDLIAKLSLFLSSMYDHNTYLGAIDILTIEAQRSTAVCWMLKPCIFDQNMKCQLILNL